MTTTPGTTLALAAGLALAILAHAGSAAAQTPLLDLQTSDGSEVATIHTDSVRLLVPLHLLTGGIRFPDGSVLSSAPAATGGTAAGADSTSEATAGTVVARDADGGFAAGPVLFTSETDDTPLLTQATGAGSAAVFQVNNAGSTAASVFTSNSGSGDAIHAWNVGTGSAGEFRASNSANDSTALVVSTAGGGNAGAFDVQNVSSAASAVYAGTQGTGAAVFGHTDGSGWAGYFRVSGQNANSRPALYAVTRGDGQAGQFEMDNASSVAPALQAITRGDGPAMEAWSDGTGPSIFGYAAAGGTAGRFEVNNTSTSNPALEATTNGSAPALHVTSDGSAEAALFEMSNTSSDSPALLARTDGTGAALEAYSGDSGPAAFIEGVGPGHPALHVNAEHYQVSDILLATTGHIPVFRVDLNGTVYADGFDSGGADLAESFAVEGRRDTYEPGDVMAISTHTDRTMELASEPYSTRVAGVYATKPGVLLSQHGVDGAPEHEVPVGVVGVVPTKVTLEGGPIRRGDLLVTSSTHGHAMRAEPVLVNGVEIYPTGAILGKALEPFDGPKPGTIQVLVNVK